METEKAISKILKTKGDSKPLATRKASLAVGDMKTAFPEASVDDYDEIAKTVSLNDTKDIHILAAAVKTRASMLVTENIKDFPKDYLASFNMEVKTADHFIADAIDLDPNAAILAIKTMRSRFKRPELSGSELIRKMEGNGLIETSQQIRPLRDLI